MPLFALATPKLGGFVSAASTLYSAQLREAGAAEPIELLDFNSMAFERIEAPS